MQRSLRNNTTITYRESIEHRKKKRKKEIKILKKFIFYNYFYKKFSK